MLGCQGDPALEVIAGVDACHQCSMVIDQTNQACGYLENRELVPFDSPGCLLKSLEQLKAEGARLPDRIFFADYQDGTWHPAESTTFLLTDRIPTVMNARVLCFSSSEAADALRQHEDETVTDWPGYRTARGNPDTVLKIRFHTDAMDPEVAEVSKGDLVLWKVTGEGLEDDLEITIKGYPEAGTITVPADGSEVTFRIMARRPGSGFPVVGSKSDTPFGRLKVTGAHTLDEEEM
jgi:hypothetical protein